MGACCGDTVEKFVNAQGGLFKVIYEFEPGSKQRTAMNHRISRLKEEWGLEDKQFVVVPCAVGNKNFKVRVHDENRGMSSCFVDDERSGESDGSVVDMVPLDVYLKNIDVSFIKADIEGFEYDMLLGARALIMNDVFNFVILCVED